MLCALPGCTKQVFVEPGGRTHAYCSKYHAQQAACGIFRGQKTCALPGCHLPCFVEANGRVHDYCGRSHAQHAQQQHGYVRAQQAQNDQFDGTKVHTVGNFVLFWQPPAVFCQWTPSDFAIHKVRYECMEMYMMAEKARLFGDQAVCQQIICTHGDPKQVKALGRQVRNFDPVVWDAHCMDIVIKGNLAKFTQNPTMKQALLETGDKVLAEASPYDTVWGIGLRADDPDCKVPSRWRGSNRLGCALMVVREQLGGGAVPRHLLPASMLPLLAVKLPTGLAGPTLPGPTAESGLLAGAAPSNMATVSNRMAPRQARHELRSAHRQCKAEGSPRQETQLGDTRKPWTRGTMRSERRKWRQQATGQIKKDNLWEPRGTSAVAAVTSAQSHAAGVAEQPVYVSGDQRSHKLLGVGGRRQERVAGSGLRAVIDDAAQSKTQRAATQHAASVAPTTKPAGQQLQVAVPIAFASYWTRLGLKDGK